MTLIVENRQVSAGTAGIDTFARARDLVVSGANAILKSSIRQVPMIAQSVAAETLDFIEDALQRDLDDGTLIADRLSGVDLLAQLNAEGISWRDLARLAEVSVPALQKWRKGERMSASNKYKVAKIVALFRILREQMISEPTSWLESPVKPGVSLSKMDILLADRFDLVLSLASRELTSDSAEKVLDKFDPEWRKKFQDESAEVFIDSDGFKSIRVKA